jgi:hypothetical protein
VDVHGKTLALDRLSVNVAISRNNPFRNRFDRSSRRNETGMSFPRDGVYGSASRAWSDAAHSLKMCLQIHSGHSSLTP